MNTHPFRSITLSLATTVAAVAQSPSAPPLNEPIATDLTDGPAPVKPAWNPTDPIRIGNQNAYLDLGLVGTFAVGGASTDDVREIQPGGHDPYQQGFSLQGVELNLSGAVDPYFRGNFSILFGMEADSETFVELEEAWAETVSLPANLKVRAGEIYTEFGRLNPTHPHSWSFVDSPLVNARLLGPDGLRGLGAYVSWLPTTPFYSELILQAQNSNGETASSFRGSSGHDHGSEESETPFAYRNAENDRGVSGIDDLLLSARYQASVDLTDTQLLFAGLSAVLGPNASGDDNAGDTTTQIYGADLTWKWTSPRQHGGFPFVQWQTEAMLRCYQAGAFDWDLNGDGSVDPGEIEDPLTGQPAWLNGETLTDYGLYTQVTYGFRKGWVAGLRLDELWGETADYEQRNLILDGVPLGIDPYRDRWWRLSPNLTYYPTEFSKLRLQYDYNDKQELGIEHAVWLQFEISLGAHAAHKF